jgi:hypothetical protein
VSQLVQQRFEERLHGSLQGCFRRWVAYCEHKVRKRYQAQLAQEHHAAALQRRALYTWRAALAAAAAEEEQKTEMAATFARRTSLGAALRQWGAWMEFQQLRRQRLAALLANLDGGPTPGRHQLVHCWQRWRQAVQQGQRLATLADELAGRRAAAQLAQVLDVWAAYTRAMRAELDPGSPFASPRAAGEDAALVFDLAEAVAGGRSSSEESDGSGSPPSSCGSCGKTINGERAPGHTSLTVAASGSPAATVVATATPVGEAGQQQEQRRRWALGVRLFRSTR